MNFKSYFSVPRKQDKNCPMPFSEPVTKCMQNFMIIELIVTSVFTFGFTILLGFPEKALYLNIIHERLFQWLNSVNFN